MKKSLFYAVFTLFFMFSPGFLGAAQKLTLMLDWFPNVDHLPIYVAQERHYFSDRHIEVKIISPSETSDALRLAAAHAVDLAVSYQPQTIMAADAGLKIKAVAPLVSHPLTTLLFLSTAGIRTPADLSGHRIGYTVPGLMDGLLKGFAHINGIQNYTPVNIGFTILPALVSGKVDAVMGPFKTYETVTLAQKGYTAQFFELEKYGIPDYEELIFVCSPQTLAAKNAAIHSFVTAVAQGIAFTRQHPDDALALYLAALPQADKKLETRAFALTRPFFASAPTHDPVKWQAFADFALQYHLIHHPVDVKELIHTW